MDSGTPASLRTTCAYPLPVNADEPTIVDQKVNAVISVLGELKTKASRKGVPMSPELAELLEDWRTQTPYPLDQDWVFASPFTQGQRPYWPESVLKDHVRPAAKKAGITKHVGWHTFRHSVGSHLGQAGENVKVVQELLRHASSRITQDVSSDCFRSTSTLLFRSAFSVPLNVTPDRT